MQTLVYCVAILILSTLATVAQNREKPLPDGLSFSAFEIDNTFLKQDQFWRGADGAATIKLDNGQILWLFSDSFISTDGLSNRSRSVLIRNSIAIQKNSDLKKSSLRFYYRGTKEKPEAFFDLKNKTVNWFWTGHGVTVENKLIVFLMEVASTNEGLGFKPVGWYIAVIDNPANTPEQWNIKFIRGIETFGVIVGSSAVLKSDHHIYAYGVKEPTHEVYLLRILVSDVLKGDLTAMEWWVSNEWIMKVNQEPIGSSLFTGQTEFSVHFDKVLKKFIQIQTEGFGHASIGYRVSDHLQGPWSELNHFYMPPIVDAGDLIYTARAHPEFKTDGGFLVTYNINNRDFTELLNNESIYFPKIIRVATNKK